MRLLYNDKWAPITSNLGFLECQLQVVVRAFSDWQKHIYKQSDIKISTYDIEAHNLEGLLKSLLPLSTVRSRYLFVQTKSKWSAFFDNGWQGSDVPSVISFLAERIGCRGLRAMYVPNTIRQSSGRYGAVIFEVYGKPNPILNIQRSISLVNNASRKTRWKFDMSGDPLSFEEVESYKSPIIEKRFTGEMLSSYLDNLGVDAFNEPFYQTDSNSYGVIVQLTNLCPTKIRNYSIEEARESF